MIVVRVDLNDLGMDGRTIFASRLDVSGGTPVTGEWVHILDPDAGMWHAEVVSISDDADVIRLRPHFPR